MEHRPIALSRDALESAERFLPSNLGIEPLAAVARALAGFNREQLGTAIEVMIALMDVADGDPDAEIGNDVEDDFVLSDIALHLAKNPAIDVVDQDAGAYVEWHTKPAAARRNGKAETMLGHEDEEDDDPDTEVEDDVGRVRVKDGPGCPHADPDASVDDFRCDDVDQDLEHEQMPQDVPMLPVFSAEHNIFNDKRVPLGISNLMSSFIGQDVRSADTGNMHSTREWTGRPGVPV